MIFSITRHWKKLLKLTTKLLLKLFCVGLPNKILLLFQNLFMKNVKKENLDVFDFELTKDEMDKIKGLDKGVSQFFDHRDPAVIDDIFGESLKQLRDSE